MKHERMIGVLAAAITLGLVAGLVAQEAAAPVKDATAAPAAMTCPVAKAQTLCPRPGHGECSKDVFVDVEGVRIYACSTGCIEKVKADPQVAIANIKANGECPECVCVVCPKCGEYQGSDKCCKPDAVKCDKCKMDKDSPGCCKPDVLGKTVACGMDASKCGMKAARAEKPEVPATATAPAEEADPVTAPEVPAEPAK